MSFIVVLVRAEAEGQKVENRSEDAAWNIMSIHQLGTWIRLSFLYLDDSLCKSFNIMQ